MSVIRAFIAIELSPEIQGKLEQLSRQLQRQLAGIPIRWVPVENIHLTLKFLGDVSLANLEVLTNILKAEVFNHRPCEISVGELGAFPSIRRPRVVWVKVTAPPELLAVQRGIEEETARLGYNREERPFKPHLTLGRVSRNARSEEVRQVSAAIESSQIGFLGAMHVRMVHLFRSDLRPSGAVYNKIFMAELNMSE